MPASYTPEGGVAIPMQAVVDGDSLLVIETRGKSLFESRQLVVYLPGDAATVGARAISVSLPQLPGEHPHELRKQESPRLTRMERLAPAPALASGFGTRSG